MGHIMTYVLHNLIFKPHRLHSTAVAPRRGSKQDMSGGDNPHVFEKTMGADEVDVASSAASDPDEPSEEEKRTLRRGQSLPPLYGDVTVVDIRSKWPTASLGVRSSWQSLSCPSGSRTTVFLAYFRTISQNLIRGARVSFQNERHMSSVAFRAFRYQAHSRLDHKVRGAIGLGQKGGTGLTNFFQFWCYITPIPGAIISDQFLGKYKTILCAGVVYICGILILWTTALPTAIEHGAALPGLVVAMIVIGCGTGGIKSNVSPLIAEQYRETKAKVRTLKSGERVIVDPAVTIQR